MNVEGDTEGIGEMLVRGGLVSPDDVKKALALQAESGERLANILIATGVLSARKFVEFLATPGESQSFDLENFEISREVILLIPQDYALQYEIVPVDKMGPVLTLAMACPLDADTIGEIEEKTELKVKPLLVSLEDIQSCLDRYYIHDAFDAEPSLETLAAPLRLSTSATLLRQLQSLPALPGTVNQVREMVHSDTASNADIAEVLSQDPAMVAKILRVANSAAYGFVNRVDNIQLAITLLGLKETYSVVLSSAVLDFFDQSRSFDYMTFWLEAMVSATMATALSKSIDGKARSGVFAAGLLRDIGRAALAQVAPEHFDGVDMHLTGLASVKAEQEHLGLSHTEAGFQLAQHWDLPDELAEAIRFHHSPEFAGDKYKALTCMINIADAVSHAHRADAESRDPSLEECVESMRYLEIAEEDVLKIFREVPEPGSTDSLIG